jgi:creatinine amidohydrolase/Fe(II)-dependent formamide hydrolase-like protein
MERYLIRYSWESFARTVPSQTDTAILPVGTIEAHGIAGLGTDIVIPELLASHIAEPLNCIICPTIPFGVTRTLLPYPGSVTVTSATFTEYCSEVLLGLTKAGFRKVIVLNGHGGNIKELRAARERSFSEQGLYSAQVEWWIMAETEAEEVWGTIGGHAACEETALFSLVHPDVATRDKWSDELAYAPAPGISALPLPGAMIIKEPGKGLPDFNEEHSAQFLDKTVERLTKELKTILAGWQRIEKVKQVTNA